MLKILALCLMVAPAVHAESLLSVPGLASVIAEGISKSKAVGLVDLNGQVSGGAFLPIRTLHDALGISYLELGMGGAIKQTEHLKPLFIADFDLSAIFRRLEGRSAWYESHVNKLKLPDFWIGPAIRIPLIPRDTWTWKNSVGGSLSVGF